MEILMRLAGYADCSPNDVNVYTSVCGVLVLIVDVCGDI